MDQTAHVLETAHLIYARANSTSTNADDESRPPVYKAIGISLAIASGCFIGVSFVLKKTGLLKANEKYHEAAGEGYGYLKNAFWWTGMTLMIVGEICNFVAYAFVDAILVTPLGALSVVITTILSAIFLKERLSMVGKVGCFLCIIGSVVIVMNAPAESSVATIQEMQHLVIAPGFLSYAGVIILSCVFIALWAGPRYGKKTMLVYLSICSLIGGLSVVATQGLGSAIVAQIGGTKQYNQWFLYVLFAFVVTTLLTEIVYLNKALNIFNAALVTPTYYVFFTSSTIITSAILFRGFKGSVTSIITVVMGFFVICAGVVLLQLSKSAKDVPDTAVFAGDLDQVRTIAEQEQPETEPKADAIRGTAAIIRRLSTMRPKMEMEEAKRLHEEKQAELQPISENETYEWDGLRRRRTTYGTNGSLRSRGDSTPFPAFDPNHSGHSPLPQNRTPGIIRSPTIHPPLGMSRFPTESELDSDEESRPVTAASSVFTRAKSIILPARERSQNQSPMHPVPLTEIAVPGYDKNGSADDTEYHGAGSGRHITIMDGHDDARSGSRGSSLHPGPTPPPHSARRQFSFQNVFRRNSHSQPQSQSDPDASRPTSSRRGIGGRKHSGAAKGATEEERLGLVKGDTHTDPPVYEEDDEEEEDEWPSVMETKKRDLTPPPPLPSKSTAAANVPQGGRRLTESPERYARGGGGEEEEKMGGAMVRDRSSSEDEERFYRERKMKWERRSPSPPQPPPHGGGGGRGGAFI